MKSGQPLPPTVSAGYDAVMPELPEVERARRLIERVGRGRRIARLHAADDGIVFSDDSPRQVTRTLRGRRLIAVHRKGKQLWLELDQRPWLLLHLGMAGQIVTPGEAAIKLASSPAKADDAWPPRFIKLHVIFDDGGEVAMTDKRRLGRIRLRTDPEREPPVSRLGFDPLLEMPTPRAFTTLLTARQAPIKAVLLDQGFAAGVGNWIADEVLYQAKIDPRRKASELTNVEAKRIRTAMARIVRKAVEVNAEKARFPKSWLFHHRWGKNSEARTAKGERIEHLTVGGRTTAWVPEVQR